MKFGDVVNDVKINVDRANNPYEYYVAGDHMNSEDLTIRKRGQFATDDVGPAFIRIFKPGQVLYGSRRTYLKKVAVADFEGISANTTFVLETKNAKRLSQRLLPFLMLTDGFTNWSIKKSKGSTNPYILFSDLANYEFDLPPIEEQERLAELLWAAYDLKESYKNLISATDEMVRSQFIEMFENGSKYPILKIEDMCSTFIDGDWIESKDQANSGIRLIQTGNIKCGYFQTKEDRARYISEETFSRLSCSEVNSGDIIISRLPDPIGRSCIVPKRLGKAITAVDCTIVRLLPICLPAYFIAFTNSPFYEKQISIYTAGSTRQRISRKNLGSIKIPCPPIEKQTIIGNMIEQANKSKTELQHSIENIEKVMKSLLP